MTFPTENKLSAKRSACYCCKGTGVAADTINNNFKSHRMERQSVAKMVDSNCFVPVEGCESVDPCKLISPPSHGQLYLRLDPLKASCIL